MLERGYKKYIDNSNKTGNSRQNFEYVQELDDILGSQRNIRPILLLSTESVEKTIPRKTLKTNEPSKSELGASISATPCTSRSIPGPSISKNRNRQQESETLRGIREDRKDYYKKRLQQEDRKLEQEETKTKKKGIEQKERRLLMDESRIDQEERKIAAMNVNNNLIRERNNLLQIYLYVMLLYSIHYVK